MFGEPEEGFTVQQLLEESIAEHNLSPEQADAIRKLAWHESKLDPHARNPKSSATGVFQFINSTGAEEGLDIAKGPTDERFNPVANIDAGIRHFLKNYESTGSIEGAVKAHYSSGNPEEDTKFARTVLRAGKVAANAPSVESMFGPPEEPGNVETMFGPPEEPSISSREALTGWNTEASPEFKLLKRILQASEEQETTNLSDLIAGPARETNLLGALGIVDLPFKYALRKPLEFIQEKLLEPGRLKSEQAMAEFAQEPGVGVGAPEAFAPTPTKGVFVPTMELAAVPGFVSLLKKALPVGKAIEAIASRLPETKYLGTVGGTAELVDLGAMESKVMDLLMKGRGVPKPTPPPPAATPMRYGEGFGPLPRYPKWYGEQEAAKAATEDIIGLHGREKTWEDIVNRVRAQRALDLTTKSKTGAPRYIPELLYKEKAFTPATPAVEIPAATPIANRALLEALGVPQRGTPPSELLQAALGSGDATTTKLLDVIKKGTVAVGAGAFLSSLISPKEAEARVSPTVMLEAVTEVANAVKGKAGRQAVEAIAGVATKRGIDAARLGETYKFLEQSGSIEGLLKEAIQPKPSFVVPPATAAPTSIAEVADELIGIRKPKRGQVDIPDKIGTTKLDPEIPIFEKDMARVDLERSPNIVSSNYMGPENNLVGDYAQSLNIFNNNMPAITRIFNNIVKRFGLRGDIAESEKAVNETIGPLFEQWRNVVKDEVRLTALIKTEKRYLAEFDPISAEAVATKEKVVELQKALASAKKDTAPTLTEIHAKRQSLLEELGAKYANVRIKAAAEGREWAKALIKPEEELAVEQTRKYLGLTKNRMTDHGMKTFESPTKDYVPYIYQTGEYGDTGKRYFAEKLWYNKKDKPNQEWLDFIARQPNSGDWYPLWKQSMDAYVPTVERSLAFNPFLRKWTPAIHEWRVGGKPMAAEWASNFINRNMSSESTNFLLQGLNKLTNLEYFHFLAGNVGTALLHLFKLVQTPIWHGFIPTVKAVGNMITAAVSPASAERALYHNYVQARLLTRALAQQPGMSTLLEQKWWKGLLDKGLNNPITNPTRLIEAWDNGVNMFAAMHSGIAKGASAQTINRAVLESQMLLNFRGFAMPRTTIHPGTRALLMFQATPFKLAENKIDLIVKALTGKTDIYGRSDMNKLVRLLVLTGLTLGTGEALGIDLHKHAGLHIPFTSETPTGEITWATPPFVKYAAAGSTGGLEAGAKSALSYWGPVQKTLEEYIPQKYSGSKVQQILGVPTKGWAKAGQAEKELQELRHLRTKLRRETRKPERIDTPYEFLLGLMGGGD